MKKELKTSDIPQLSLARLVEKLNQGYECDVRYINERVTIGKSKRKLLYKVQQQDANQPYVMTSILQALDSNPNAKVEFKKENDKLVIVVVERIKIY